MAYNRTMRFFQRLGLGLATSIFSTFLVVFAISVSIYMVLDKPQNVKDALRNSGAYQVLVDNALQRKQQQLGVYLPVENSGVQQAVRQAFSTTYLQNTTERNIDATYAWVHGETTSPHYSADLSEPKTALAQNLSQLVEQKVSALPPCTSVQVTPTTLSDVLALQCRPIGISTGYLVAAAQQGVGQSNVFDQVVAPILTLQDEQGKSLTSSLSVVPKAYHYFVLSLFIVPVILLLAALAIVFWSESRRQGIKALARSLLVTGIVTILLSLAAVWGLGKAAQLASDSSADLLLIQGKFVGVAHLLGAQLRNWLIIIGGAYIVLAIGLWILVKVRQSAAASENRRLNTSLGYNQNIPSAGTTFEAGDRPLGPTAGPSSPEDKPEDRLQPPSQNKNPHN